MGVPEHDSISSNEAKFVTELHLMGSSHTSGIFTYLRKVMYVYH